MLIPIVRAETFYLPPPGQPADAWALVPPAERAFRWVELRQQRRLEPPAGLILGHKIYARINHGRWVADCPCGSAQVVTPADQRMACTECGAGWFQLLYPEDADAAEAEVIDKLPHERNWWHPDDESWDRPPPPPEPEPEGMELANALASAVLAGAPRESLSTLVEEVTR